MVSRIVTGAQAQLVPVGEEHPLPGALPGPARDAADGLQFAFYLHLFRKNAARIAAFVLLVSIGVFLACLAVPRRYAATAMVRIDPQASGSTGEAQNNGVGLQAAMLVNTEASVATSEVVVRQAIGTLGIAGLPEFAKYANRPEILLRNVTKRIGVDQPAGTLLLKITFTAQNPDVAANIANGLAKTYLENDFQTRAAALSDSTRSMRGQIDSLRAQMEKAQLALVQYESTHDVINPDDSNNIYRARLEQINQDLSTAQSNRMKLQGEDQVAAAGDLDALIASPDGQNLLPLQQKLQSDTILLGRMGVLYGTEHPLYLQQQNTVAVDAEALNNAEKSVRAQVGAEFQAAQDREQLIQTALQQEKQSMDAFNLRAIQYQTLQAAADSAKKLYYDLQQRAQDATVGAGLQSEELRIISPAFPDPTPVFPRPFAYTLLGALAALFLAAGVTVAMAMIDRSITSPEQVEFRFGVQALAALPLLANADLASLMLESSIPAPMDAAEAGLQPHRKMGAFEEAIMGLRSALEFHLSQGSPVLTITSALPAEGKSLVASHLAASFARTGRRTLLIDADLRKPKVHLNWHLPNRAGFSTLLRGEATPGEVAHTISPNLDIVTAGRSTARPAELFYARAGQVLEDLRGRYDLVIVDCPPVLGFADSPTIATFSDGTLLVVAAGNTKVPQVRAAIRELRSVRAPLLGVLLNRVSSRLHDYYSYYDKYSQYYESADQHGGETADSAGSAG